MKTQTNNDLVFYCLKKNNCFLKKFNGITFSSEPLNFLKLNKQKYSGLTGQGLEVQIQQNKLVLKKNKGCTNKPKNNVQTICLGTNYKAAVPKIERFITNYRPGLIKDVKKAIKATEKINLQESVN